jgi:hypothetical protein
MATTTNDITHDYTIAVDHGADWAAIYDNGVIHAVGHVDDLQEQLLDMLGVTTESVSYDSQAASEIRKQIKATGKRDFYAERMAGWPQNLNELATV